MAIQQIQKFTNMNINIKIAMQTNCHIDFIPINDC